MVSLLVVSSFSFSVVVVSVYVFVVVVGPLRVVAIISVVGPFARVVTVESVVVGCRVDGI